MGRGPGFYAGLLLGAAVGVAVGLLFAPRPGRQIRQDLLEGSGEWGDRVQEATTLARAAADTVVEASRDLVDQQRQRFQEAVRESREAAEQTTARMLAQLEKAQRGEIDIS